MDDATASNRAADGRWAVIAFVALGVIVFGYFALGMPGMDHDGSGGSAMTGMDHDAGGGSRTPGMGSPTRVDIALGVDEFAGRMDTGVAFVVNVHVPPAGMLEGTDATIAYDQVVGDDRLPTGTSTPILLYCQTGRMSALAADALMRAGYADVAYLEGGIDAWVASGRTLS